MLTVITKRKYIDSAQAQFVQKMRAALPYKAERNLGFQGDSRAALIYYDDQIGLWFTTDDGMNGSRYWNPLGSQSVSKHKSLNIVAEINFPFVLDRRVGGIFLEDEDGEIYIGHRGKIGGGRPGIGKKAFMQYYKGSTGFVLDGNQESEVLIISALNSSRLAENIKGFIDSVDLFKKSVINNDFDVDTEGFLPEPEEKTSYSITETIDSEMLHGSVVNELHKVFKQRGLIVENTKHIDLMLLDKKRKTTHLFEVKSKSDSQSIYTAIGQLQFNARRLRTNAKQIIVVPVTINNHAKKILEDLSFSIVTFVEEKKQFKFFGLEEFSI